MKIPMMFFNAAFLSVLMCACAMEQPQEAKDSLHESMLEAQEAIPPPRKPELLAELIQSKENELQMRDYFNAANDELWSKAQEMENLAKYVEELSKGELKAVEIAELARLKEENTTLKERIKILEEAALGVADTQKLKAQVCELRARIEKLKQEYVPPEKYQAALDAAQKSKSESSALQAENAWLKEAVSAAKARGDEAWKLTEQLTAKFDELSRKYERFNEFLRKKN